MCKNSCLFPKTERSDQDYGHDNSALIGSKISNESGVKGVLSDESLHCPVRGKARMNTLHIWADGGPHDKQQIHLFTLIPLAVHEQLAMHGKLICYK